MTSQIIINDPQLAPDFKTLNIAWLEKFFVVEPIDEQVLSHPEHIIENGGFIFYIKEGEQVLGCCAMKHQGNQVYELTKMAVTEGQQGKGLGKKLLHACIEQFKIIKGSLLYLETHSSLIPAIKLYEKNGFVAKKCPFESIYNRSDYYMEWSC